MFTKTPNKSSKQKSNNKCSHTLSFKPNYKQEKSKTEIMNNSFQSPLYFFSITHNMSIWFTFRLPITHIQHAFFLKNKPKLGNSLSTQWLSVFFLHVNVIVFRTNCPKCLPDHTINVCNNCFTLPPRNLDNANKTVLLQTANTSFCISWLSWVCKSLSFFLRWASAENTIFSGLREPQDSTL